jgi:hypothetical protein
MSGKKASKKSGPGFYNVYIVKTVAKNYKGPITPEAFSVEVFATNSERLAKSTVDGSKYPTVSLLGGAVVHSNVSRVLTEGITKPLSKPPVAKPIKTKAIKIPMVVEKI